MFTSSVAALMEHLSQMQGFQDRDQGASELWTSKQEVDTQTGGLGGQSMCEMETPTQPRDEDETAQTKQNWTLSLIIRARSATKNDWTPHRARCCELLIQGGPLALGP